MKECWILLTLTVLTIAVKGTTTYVCVAIDDTSVTKRCNHMYHNISLAFELHHDTSDMTFLIQPGNYTLLPVNITFDSLNNTNIIGNSSKDKEIIINCQPFAGLYFYQSHNIKISNVSFIGCGATYRHSDTSNISLYFLQCSNVNIEAVNIANTTGIAMSMDETLGSNVIKGCTFQHNIPFPHHTGGSIFVSFPKSSPLSTIEDYSEGIYYHPNQVSYANYTIYNCTFRNNEANLEKRLSRPDDLNHGRGGGLVVKVLKAQHNTLLVDKCLFEYNKALYGGGAYITISDDSKYNTITFQRSNFTNNAAIQGGGGVRILFLIHHLNESAFAHDNQVYFHSCHFIGNNASLGGGVSLYTTNQQNMTNNISFYDSIWSDNTAKTGSAVDATAWLSFDGVLPQPYFSNCTFYKNKQKRLEPFNGVSDPSSVGTMYLDSVSVILDNVNFTENQATAIYSINNHLVFDKDSCSIFDRNNGTNGGAIALIGNAAIVAEANVTVNFINNTASVHGGAIYAFVTSQHEDIVSINCFVHYYKPMDPPTSWQALFYFRDNTVNGRNETIFATTLQYCAWEYQEEDTTYIFCTGKNQWDFGPNSNCKEQVRTLPKQITMSSPFLSVVLGKRTAIHLNVTDDNGNSLDSYVLIITSTSELEVDKDYHYISDNRVKLDLKNHSSLHNINKTIMLQTLFPRVLELEVPVIPLLCPPGYWINEKSGVCECRENSFGGNIIRCQPANFSALIRKGYWIGHYKGVPVAGRCQFCAANFNQKYGGFIQLPKLYEDVDDILCGGKKNGVLCTSCSDDGSFALTLTSFECLDCPSNSYRYTWLLFLLTRFLPVIILVLILFCTNFSLASGYLNAAIFFSQAITTALDISGDGEIPLSNVTKSENTVEVLLEMYYVLYDVWNLYFLDPIKFCLLPHISVNMIFVLQYIVALSPMLIVLIIFIYYQLDERTTCTVKLWRYLIFLHICRRIESKWKHKVENRAQINYKERFRNIIASCILLSYTRCALNTCYILNGTPLYDSNNSHVATVPIFDGSTKFGHGHHIIYMSISIGIAVFFLIPVPFILFCKRHNPNRDTVNNTFLNVLLRAFQCDYKDGHIQREGYVELTRPTPCNKIKHYSQSMWHFCFSDLRWVASLYFALRLAMALTFVLANTLVYQVLIQQLLAITMVIVFLILQPYKNELHNKIDGCIFLLIVVINSITLYQYSLTVAMEKLSITAFVFQYILVYVPMTWIGGYVLYKIINFCRDVRKRSRGGDEQEINNLSQPTDGIQ